MQCTLHAIACDRYMCYMLACPLCIGCEDLHVLSAALTTAARAARAVPATSHRSDKFSSAQIRRQVWCAKYTHAVGGHTVRSLQRTARHAYRSRSNLPYSSTVIDMRHLQYLLLRLSFVMQDAVQTGHGR
jgi:hypothetical protein